MRGQTTDERAQMATTGNPMKACPRYDKCSAPICPLDPDWRLRSHLPGEPVCRWLTELAKPGGERRLRGELSEATASAIVQIAPAILSHAGAPVRKVIKRASGTGSKLEQHWKLARHLQKQRHGVESTAGVISEAREGAETPLEPVLESLGQR
jgi:hypothetical protein